MSDPRTSRLLELGALVAVAAALAGAVVATHAVAPTAAKSPPAQEGPGAGFVVQDVRVFDGTGVIDRATVVVRDGRIVSVGRDAQVPEGLAVVDGRGRTLLPGLIDAHVHSWGDAQADALRFGVTTELDMLGDRGRFAALRSQRDAFGPARHADLWSAGAAVTAPGGHGTQYGMEVPTLAAGGDAGAFVAARVAEGSDYIKIIVEDFGAYGSPGRMPTLAPAQVEAAVEAAHAHDRLAVVHVSRQADALHALRAGADGLVHLFVDAGATPELVAAARAGDAFVVPTLSVLMSIAGAGAGPGLAADPRLRPHLSDAQVHALQGSFPGMPAQPALPERLLASVRALHAAGVTILAGTDAGNPGTSHGASLHGELALLVQAGLTPLEALAAATSAPATRFGLADRGRIAPGLRADLVLVEGDPSSDIAASRAIVGIWKNGHAVARDPAAAAGAGPAGPAPAGPLLSAFDDGTFDATSGSWHPTTDRMLGGTSDVAHRILADGAAGTGGALEITGEVRQGASQWTMWSGMMWMLGAEPMAPVDLSGRSELVFHARGDGRDYHVMLFSGPEAHAMPAMRAFRAGPEWEEVRMPLEGFANADPARLRAIAFTAGAPAGSFGFRIDQVELR